MTVLRCYKCNGFHHGKNSCKNDISCPLCSDKHSVKQCKANESDRKYRNCVGLRKYRNCVGLRKNQKWDIKSITLRGMYISDLRTNMLWLKSKAIFLAF